MFTKCNYISISNVLAKAVTAVLCRKQILTNAIESENPLQAATHRNNIENYRETDYRCSVDQCSSANRRIS